MADTFADWCSLYRRLTSGNRTGRFDRPQHQRSADLPKGEANQAFSKFVRRNYYDWINKRTDDSPVMSHTLMRSKIFPGSRRKREDDPAAHRQLPLRPMAGHLVAAEGLLRRGDGGLLLRDSADGDAICPQRHFCRSDAAGHRPSDAGQMAQRQRGGAARTNTKKNSCAG